MTIRSPEEFIADCMSHGLSADAAGMAWHDYLEQNYEALKPHLEAMDRRQAEWERQYQVRRAEQEEIERTTHVVEVHREHWTGELSQKDTCRGCGKAFTLHFNGGELDGHSCCGYEYYLQHAEIDYVIEQRQPRGPVESEPSTGR